jgi:hypothetical protein
MLSCAIDGKEGCDVATADIHGAFMQTDMDQTVYMQIDGVMAELLIKIDPDIYLRHAYQDRGKTGMYVQLKEALYVTVTTLILFWKDLSSALIDDWGFKCNPYDWCVINKLINRKQFFEIVACG